MTALYLVQVRDRETGATNWFLANATGPEQIKELCEDSASEVTGWVQGEGPIMRRVAMEFGGLALIASV